MSASLCGGTIGSRRGLLASLWSVLTILTGVAFLLALIFTLSAKDDGEYQYYYDEGEEEREQDIDPEIAVTSRAMAFAALWTAVLATLMGIFGTVILGWQSPTGQYYTCCSSQVHRTTPLALGSFIGSLIMFANLTLVCSVLFGEFEIRDYQREGEAEQERKDTAVHRSSMAFSIMCMFLTVMYAGFAALTFTFSQSVLSEMDADEHEESALASARSKNAHFVGGYDGYIGERFDVRPNSGTPGFVAPQPADGTLT